MSSFNSEVGLLEKCKGCAKEFKPESLLRHVGKAKKCLAKYEPEEYENLKREKYQKKCIKELEMILRP